MRTISPLLALCLVLACTADLDSGEAPPSPVHSAVAATGSSQAMITWAPRDVAEAPAPIRLTASDGTGLHLTALDARTVVQDPIAFTELRLSFKNPEARVREGRFEINLPEGAAISRFAMKIDGRWQEGEVVEKQRARRVYEDFLHRGQDPALLEKAPGNTFSARVFPIPANGVKDLIISWSQELGDSDDGLALPLGGLPEVEQLSASVNVDYGDGEPSSVFKHEARNEVPRGDLVVDFGGAVRSVGLRSAEYAVVRVKPQLDVTAAPLKRATLLFDTSASRAPGFASQVERLRSLVGALPDQTELRILAFDQDVEPIFEGKARRFDATYAARILEREALGASNLQGALRYVAANPAGHDRLIVMGDGVATAGAMEAGPLEVEIASLGEVGFGRVDAIVDGGLRDEELLNALTHGELAQDGVVLDANLGTAELARRLSLGTAAPVAVSVPGSQWVWPRSLDGLQPGDEALVYAVVEAGKPVQVMLDGTAHADSVRWLDVERPLLERAAVAANLRRLDHERSTVEDSEREAELTSAIVGLSTRYRVLTDDTALLVLETEADYARYEIAQDALADILTVSTEGGVALLQRSSVVVTRAPEVVENLKFKAEKKDAAAPADGFIDGRELDRTAAMVVEDADGLLDVGDVTIIDGEGMYRMEGQAQLGASGGSSSSARSNSPSVSRPMRGRRGDVAQAEAPAAVDVPAPVITSSTETAATGHIMVEESRELIQDVRPAPPAPEAERDEKLRRVHPWEGRYDRFQKRLSRGDTKGALSQARAWHAEDPGDVLALVALGEALEASGDHVAAARAWGSIIDLFPGRADMRRMAGERLATLGDVGHDLAIDTWTVATTQRPDHLNGWRLLATGHLASGDAQRAFEVLEDGLKSDGVRARPGVVDVLREDLGLAGAAWIAQSPKERDAIVKRAQAADAVPPTGPSTRFVLSWETDANDVDLHVWDRKGNHAFYSHKELASGGALLADVTNGYGPELFVLDQADAGPYKLAAHYYSRGPMGYGMGTLQIVTHDGRGGITVDDRPFVVMVDDATVDLGTWGDRQASR